MKFDIVFETIMINQIAEKNYYFLCVKENLVDLNIFRVCINY